MTSETPETTAERLKLAMKQRGLDTGTQLAELTGFPATTVRSHLNGFREIPRDKLAVYAAKLLVDAEWLAFGRGKGPQKSTRQATTDYRIHTDGAGGLIIDIPADSLLRGDIEKLLVKYAGADKASRDAALLRLTLPDTPGAEKRDPVSDWLEGVKTGLRSLGVTPNSAREFNLLAAAMQEREAAAGLTQQQVDNIGPGGPGIGRPEIVKR